MTYCDSETLNFYANNCKKITFKNSQKNHQLKKLKKKILKVSKNRIFGQNLRFI